MLFYRFSFVSTNPWLLIDIDGPIIKVLQLHRLPTPYTRLGGKENVDYENVLGIRVSLKVCILEWFRVSYPITKGCQRQTSTTDLGILTMSTRARYADTCLRSHFKHWGGRGKRIPPNSRLASTKRSRTAKTTKLSQKQIGQFLER